MTDIYVIKKPGKSRGKTTFFYRRILPPSLYACLLALLMQLNAGAQNCYTNQGCQDYSNFGFNSSTAATLEYDNFVSSFHSTIVRDIDGNFKIWGQYTKSTGTSDWTKPTIINVGNFPGLTGTPLKAAVGSSQTSIQHILLTSDNKLWAWGTAGTVVSTGVRSVPALGSFSLPAGVTAADVKMIFGTYQTLVLTTCGSKGGRVYVLSQNDNMRGDGGTGAATWATVQKSTGGDLTGIVATRGCPTGLIALDQNGGLWTWGDITYNGDNAGNPSARSKATAMILPGGSGNIKMIGATGTDRTTANAAYYVLYENNNLYAIGNNTSRQLGNWSTTSSNAWLQPRYTSTSGQKMNDIAWISPNEHDNYYPSINVVTTGKKLYNWGLESGYDLGRGVQSSTGGSTAVDPGLANQFPSGFSNDNIIVVETGGHTTLIAQQCQDNFGYVGHKTNGSMGDGSTTGGSQKTFSFNTAAVQICGAPTVDAGINTSVNTTDYCRQQPVTLYPYPANIAGATLSITSGGSIASLNASTNVLSFSGTGTVVVTYKVNISGCNPATVTRTFNVVDCSPTVTIPGKVWDDKNGDAKTAASGEPGIANGLWANLVDPDGVVVASVKVADDGSFQIVVDKGSLTSGNYSIILTNAAKGNGDLLTGAETPAGGYGYTGTNSGTDASANRNNRTGKFTLANLNQTANNGSTSPVNFGISNDPTALPVTFGAVSAKIVNRQLVVNWSTMSEVNNDHFEIEVSNDGTHFTRIGSVKSQAPNGNATEVINYKFEVDAQGAAAALGIGVLAFGALAFGFSRRQKVFLIVVMMAGGTLFFTGCKRDVADLNNTGSIQVRVVQVDIDGNRTFSKIVQAVAE
ncbi:hypothetical protein [Niabella drilacis]|uniref:Alpha-tubulin suppressor n=1 Tax=Niabella drilacis (strain DSM 25811 / CCM 8410 / CCUG 62505 / LMG 26954 / E90) TaxID=1285928 RepID=A0A1G6PW97_NIADE|nr:hypothetical protein [Niabella drilacis]SDC84389.1 hypothetical protein SAMN04487894_104186 [Niabella drilacis]